MSDILGKAWHLQHDDEVWCGEQCIANCGSPEIAESIVSSHNIILVSLAISKNITLDWPEEGGLKLDLNTDFSALSRQFYGDAS